MITNAVSYVHSMLRMYVTSGDVVVDATLGNGHDATLLASLVGPTGFVYGFDIQSRSIEAAGKALGCMEASTRLIHDGHQHMERHVLPDHIGIVAAVVFNLGYLPGGDKSITTKAESTVQAVEQSLQILRDGSPLIIVCYRHPEGNREFDVLQQFCSDLPQTRYTVMRTEFVNQRGNPPVVFVVVPALTGDPR